jgi:hypothetical protein
VQNASGLMAPHQNQRDVFPETSWVKKITRVFALRGIELNRAKRI